MPIKSRCLAMVLALLLTATTWAQGYPRRPIKVLVPYAPGGATDTVSRIVAPALSEILKQQTTGAAAIVDHELLPQALA